MSRQLLRIDHDDDVIESAPRTVVYAISRDVGIGGVGKYIGSRFAVPVEGMAMALKLDIVMPVPMRRPLSIRRIPLRSMISVVYQAWMGRVTVANAWPV